MFCKQNTRQRLGSAREVGIFLVSTINNFASKCPNSLIASSQLPGARGNLTKFGTTHDRFCGGQLNSESNEEESVPLYSEITSQIIWLQLVTGSRDLFAMQELEERSTNHRGNYVHISKR